MTIKNVSSALALVATALFVSSALAATPHESFQEANRALSAGHYEQAAHAYEAILAEHGGAPGLYTNLGRAYEGLGEVGPAVAAYERARQMMPFDRRVQARLDALRQQAGLEAPAPGILRYLADGSPEVFSWILIASGLLLSGIAVAWALRPARKWRPLLALGILGFALSVPAVAAWERWHPDYVVVADSAAARISPFGDAEAAFSLKPGEVLRGGREIHGFVFVTTPDGRRGWVKQDQLTDLAAPAAGRGLKVI